MKTFVSNNVEVLFMEGFDEDLQEDLDAYFDPQTEVEAMPLSIQYKFGYLEETLKSQGGYTMMDIIKSAKVAGIKRIVGIDTILSPVNNDRISTMNYFAKQVIDREMPEGKYVIFSGAAHATFSSDTNIPNFSQLFGIPSLFIQGVHLRFGRMISNKRNEEIPCPTIEDASAKLRCTFLVNIPLKECKKP